MRIMTALRLLALPAMAWTLQACLGAGGGPTSAAQPLPLLALPADQAAGQTESRPSREEARAQAIAEIRAKAAAAEARQASAPYPDVFATHGPPLDITSVPQRQHQIEAQLARVRSELERASDPDEVAELEERMAQLLEIGRSHERDSEETIRAISERMR